MMNTGELTFVDRLNANIGGHFINDVIVLTEYDAVHAVKGPRTYTGYAAYNQIKNNSGKIIAIGDSSKEGLLNVQTGGNFTHRGDIDVSKIKFTIGGDLDIQNLPDQFVVKWDPGGKSKKGQDCFSVASQFTPSHLRARDGSINIVVGGDAKIYASLLSAAEDIWINAKSIQASARGEHYLGNVSIENRRRERTTKKESDIIIQKVRLEAGGNLRLIARHNIDVEGGEILAALEVVLNGENITLKPIQIVGENHVSQYGTRGFSYYKDTMTYSTHGVQTTDIVANHIKLAARNNVNIQASMLMAFEDIEINAGNDINIVEDLVHRYVHSKHFSAHLEFFGRKATHHAFQKQYVAAGRAFAREFGILKQVERLIEAIYKISRSVDCHDWVSRCGHLYFPFANSQNYDALICSGDT
jgi:hypothetical protein